MKITLSILCLYTIGIINAQDTKALDTIHANGTNTVSVFFPKPIRQAVVGIDHFVFSYNSEEEQHFGLLQASPGEKSNLLVITNDGQIYSYILKYNKKLSILNYFISIKESIGNEIPVECEEQIQLPKENSIHKSDLDKYAKNCTSFLKNSKMEILKIKRKHQIQLMVRDIEYIDGALYYMIEIQNNSSIDYEMDYLRFFTKNKSGLNPKSIQTLQIHQLYQYQFPRSIKAGSKARFVIVLGKFTVDGQKKKILVLNEKDGERDLKLMLKK